MMTPIVRRRAFSLTRSGFLAVAVLFAIVPIYWIIQMAFKRPIDTLAAPPKIFFDPTLEEFKAAFDAVPLWRFLRNSLIVALGSTALGLVSGIGAAYALVRLPFKGQQHYEFWVLSSRMAPPIVVAVPFFVAFRKLGLQDTLIGLVIVHVVLVVAMIMWILIETFKGIPEELTNAALVDGADEWTAFRLIALPLAGPGIAGAAVISFLLSWNEFFLSLVLTTNDAKTVPVGLFNFIGFQSIELNQLAGASTMMLIPATIVILFFQKYLVAGLSRGGLKE